MTSEKRKYVVSAMLILCFIILLRILALKATNYWLTPKVGHSFGRMQKILVNDGNGVFHEETEWNQVKVYNYTNDSVYYILTEYNGINCNDSLASTIVEFSAMYR